MAHADAVHVPHQRHVALDVVVGPRGVLLLRFNLCGIDIQNHFLRFRLQTGLDQASTDLLDRLGPRQPLPAQPVSYCPGVRHRLQAQRPQHLLLGPELPQVL